MKKRARLRRCLEGRRVGAHIASKATEPSEYLGNSLRAEEIGTLPAFRRSQKRKGERGSAPSSLHV